mmetsp:Transcript_37592/g.118352  ORF Transcript_37592/g.118352 Transcript_37592/m.118352 type:complete len:226 (-) Transcript_37592:1006-1683(-)
MGEEGAAARTQADGGWRHVPRLRYWRRFRWASPGWDPQRRERGPHTGEGPAQVLADGAADCAARRGEFRAQGVAARGYGAADSSSEAAAGDRGVQGADDQVRRRRHRCDLPGRRHRRGVQGRAAVLSREVDRPDAVPLGFCRHSARRLLRDVAVPVPRGRPGSQDTYRDGEDAAALAGGHNVPLVGGDDAVGACERGGGDASRIGGGAGADDGDTSAHRRQRERY